MIPKAICENCRRRNKNLSTAWIDDQKAFDSIPHSWVEKSIALVTVNSKIVRFCKLSMEKWTTGSNAITTNSDTKRNIPRGLSFAISLLHSTHCISKRAEQNCLWMSITWNREENKSLSVHGWLETARKE